MKALLLITFLMSFPVFSSEECSHLKDDCEYYACVSESKNCKKRSYLLGFGHRYCMKFSRKKDDFTKAGQEFIDEARNCLIERLDEIQDETLSCRAYKKVALSHHMPCYLQAGFCQLPKKDRNRVIRNVVKSMWRPSLIKSGIEILSACKRSK